MYTGLHVNPTILVRLLNTEFSQHIYDKYSNTKFHRNSSSGNRIFLCRQTDRRRDRHGEANRSFPKLCERAQKKNKNNHVSYCALTESCRIHVYVVQYVIYMVRCEVQRCNMQKQIDATRYIVPYKTDDWMSIIVLRYARRRMRIVPQGRLTL